MRRCLATVLLAVGALAANGLAQEVPPPPPAPDAPAQPAPPGELASAESAARIAALQAMAAAAATPRAIEAAAAALLDGDPAVRAAAVESLLQLRSDLAGVRERLAEIAAGTTEMLFDFCIASDFAEDLAPVARQLAAHSAEQRCAAVQSLCARGQSADAYLDDLLALRADPAATVRAALVAGIANVAWTDEVRKVQLLLLKDEVASVRAAAATALGVDRDEPELVAALRGAVQDPEVEVRAAVLRAFGQCGKCGLAAVLDVLGSTRDREAKVRAAAFDAMASFALADARALRGLGRGLADADLGVLRAAIQAAQATGTGAESLSPRLLELTRHGNAEVRTGALQAAFAVADPARRGAPVLRLVESLLDADEGVRTQAEFFLRDAIHAK